MDGTDVTLMRSVNMKRTQMNSCERPTMKQDSQLCRQRAQRCIDMAQLATREADWCAMMSLAKYYAGIAEDLERTEVKHAA